MMMNTVWITGFLLAYAGAATLAFAASEPHPLVPDDFYKLQQVTDPQVAPDGQWVAYLVTTNDRQSDERLSAVWMVSWDGRQQVQLTSPASGIRTPRWSPDNRYLAFVGIPTGSEHNQIMLLDRRGGAPRPLTAVNDEIETYAWSPDGKRLVLVMQTSGEQAASHPTPDGGVPVPSGVPKPIVIDSLHFKEDEDGYLGSGHGRHLYVLNIDDRQLEPLTNDPQFNEDNPVWSPNGEKIAFVRERDKGPDSDGMQDIDVIEVRPGAEARRVVRPYAPHSQHLAWSPDGRLIAYLQGREPKYVVYMEDRLAVIPAGGGTPRPLTDSLDRPVQSYAFTVDSRSMTVTVADDGSTYPARILLDSGAINKLLQEPAVISSVSVSGGHTAVLASTDEAASEVHALDSSGLRRLTHHNDALLAELQLGTVETLRFQSRDGTQIHGLMVKPPTYIAGRKYPTILWIHGGPDFQDQHVLPFDLYPLQFERQLLAAQGYVVLAVNYRGSSGRGEAFSKAIFADWGHKEVQDLLAGIDYVVAHGIADPARLGIGGWSYGGMLTDYAIASDPRFKAAFSGAGIGNELSMYGSDEYILQYNNELTPPWRNPSLWIKLSYPFFHAERINTPTLFMGGEKDFDVPIAGSEQMYEALRTLGIPTELVIYPGQYHLFTRPSYMVDRANRVASWYARYLEPNKK